MKHAIEVFHTAQGDVAHHNRVAGVLVGTGDLAVLVDADVLQTHKAVHSRSTGIRIARIHIFAGVGGYPRVDRVALTVLGRGLHGEADGDEIGAGIRPWCRSRGCSAGLCDKPIDHVALAVRQIAVPEFKVAHPGQG